MTQYLNPYDSRCLLDDPDLLAVPVNFAARPLPELIEPAEMPLVEVPALRDQEPLVQINHSKILVLGSYCHAGWALARPEAFVRSGVLDRLMRVAANLPGGFGLAIIDAWRPLDLQSALYEAAYSDTALPEGFVSPPSNDPTTPPPHLTGGCVDVTLTWNGRPLALGSAFDDFTIKAQTATYEPTPGRVRQLRRLLYWAMRAEDFVVIDCEWWHYELGTRRWAALTGNTPLYSAADLAASDVPATERDHNASDQIV